MGPTSNARWFAVHTLPRKETLAAHHLQRQGFETFLPLLTVTRRHARKQETALAALFPRYAFVRLDLARDRWRSINGTIGVSAIVTAHERPCPIPEGIVEELAERADPAGRIDLDDDLQPGDQVRILQGPLAGCLGVLMRLDEKGRVEMLLDFMRASVRVKVARGILEAAI